MIDSSLKTGGDHRLQVKAVSSLSNIMIVKLVQLCLIHTLMLGCVFGHAISAYA